MTRAQPALNVELVSAHRPGEIVAGHGIHVICANEMSNAVDVIMVPSPLVSGGSRRAPRRGRTHPRGGSNHR
jgi:hypothetical protein